MSVPKQRGFREQAAANRTSHGQTALVCILLAVTTLGVYWPVVFNAFTNYDDTYYVTENAPVQRGLSWAGLVWAFGSLHGEHTYWHPLTWVSHMLDYELFGLRAWGHHLVSLLFHALNTVLVFLVFQRMTGAFWRCVALAGLFALHPLQVDTVAWVAERKNLLSAMFWLLTMLAYARYAQRSKAQDPKFKVAYGLALGLYVCGLMCKPVLVTLPFVLLLLDYWPLRRLELNAGGSALGTLIPFVREKVPFFFLAAMSCGITILAHRGLGMLEAASRPSLDLRLENAAVSYVRYLGKAIWPSQLAVFYPYPNAWPTWIVLGSGLLLLGVSGLAILMVRNRPYLLTGWFWFLGVLVPFIGVVQVGAQAMADRFVYVPLIGLFLAVVWAAHELIGRRRQGTQILVAVAVVAALTCTVTARKQIGFWKDDETLFRRTLGVTQDNGLARLNLGAALNSKRRFEEAVGHLQEAIRLNPGKATAHINLAYALAQMHRLAEAVQQYEVALQLKPADAGVHNDLGLTLARQGQWEAAIRHYAEALRLKPGFAEAHYNLGLALAARRNYGEAAAQFAEVLRLRPNAVSAQEKLERALAAEQKLLQTSAHQEAVRSNPADARAHTDLGQVLLEAGEVEQALEHLIQAVRLNPQHAETHYHFGRALAQKGETKRATRQFVRALELEPNFAAAHYALGVVLEQQQQTAEALKHWREAARLAPQWADPLNNLAWGLATDPRAEVRDGVEAVRLATQAVELSGTNNVAVLDTLAAAYAEAGRFAEAAATARQAQLAATALGQANLAQQIQKRLALYEANRPYRWDPSKK